MGVVTDPVADMLTRIRNAVTVHHDTVTVPASNLKIAIAKVLKEEGFVKNYELVRGQPHRVLKLYLAYSENGVPLIRGVKRVSKPGLRAYVGKRQVPRPLGGLGIAIMTTPRGVMSGKEANKLGTGGEVLCLVW
ncbi:MAG: 30S ribosomal protein S8 [Chloroflexi bacterium]|nr:30S ribosomal protein S8 [Chloroflexota bacterium]